MTPETNWLRRIRRPAAVWALTALLVQLVVERLLRDGAVPPGPAHISIALAPLIPALLFMVALVRMIQHMDELQQRICLESVFIAFIGSLTVVFVFAGLEQAGAYQPAWDTIGTWMMVLWACGYVYSSWKYR